MLCEKCGCEMVYKYRRNNRDIFSCVNKMCENFDYDFLEKRKEDK